MQSVPRVFLADGVGLVGVRAGLRAGDGAARPAADRLDSEAAEALGLGPWSVVEKKGSAPSGDPHDFVGFAAYWWPNPETKDGLPYVPRDGVVNPEQADFDGTAIRAMTAAFNTLATHAFFTGSEVSGRRAAQVLERWFVDPDTRMNPHLEYGGYTPGVWNGTGWGIVGTHVLVELIESVALLDSAGSLPPSVHGGFMKWVDAYLDWLLTSDHGRFEADRPNNHATAYDAQVMMMALHLGRDEVARKVAESIAYRRIGLQLEHNGQQPWEVARTKSWAYSTGNLLILMHLADLAAGLGVDLWNYATADGRCLRRSLDYMLPSALGHEKWPWPVIEGWTGAGEKWVEILRRASRGWNDRAFDALAPELDGIEETEIYASRIQLICPLD